MKTLFVISIIAMTSHEVQSRPEIDWFDSLKTRLYDSHEVHAAVIIHHHDAGDSDAVKDELFRKIMSSMSSLIVEMKDEGIMLTETVFGTISKLSTSLLFIFYTEYSGNNEQIYRFLDSIDEFADLSVNYLLIVLRASSSFTIRMKNILISAWNMSILNIMVVEIPHSKIHDNSSRVMIHQFNPFIGEFYHDEFSRKMELFPNFAENMQGRHLNVIVSNQGRYSVVGRNKNVNKIEVAGPNIILMQTLAEKLNFTPLIRFPTGTLENLDVMIERHELDITPLLFDNSPSTNDRHRKSTRSQVVMKMELRVLMPKKYKLNGGKLKNALQSGGLTLAIIIIIWFAVILLKFDDKIWQVWSILGLLISIVVPHQPSSTYERILFFFVAMLGFMYSNDIYASLTNLGIGDLVEHKYETFEDIDNSGLTLSVVDEEHLQAFRDTVGNKLSVNEETMSVSECTEMAMVHRNVCCIGYVRPAEADTPFINPKNGEVLAKFGEPILRSTDMSFMFRQGLPGRRKMNRVIERCDETGHLAKWYWNLRGSLGHTNNVDDDAQLRDKMLHDELLKKLIVVVVVGHSLASLVFIGELLIHRFGNDFKRESKIDLWSVYKRGKT